MLDARIVKGYSYMLDARIVKGYSYMLIAIRILSIDVKAHYAIRIRNTRLSYGIVKGYSSMLLGYVIPD